MVLNTEQPGLFGSRAGRRRGAVSMVLLASTLGLAAVLAYQAVDSAGSHRETVANTLRDYAGVAAWEFARRARNQMHNAMHEALTPARDLPSTRGSGDLPSPNILQASVSRAVENAHTLFRVDLLDGGVTVISEREPSLQFAWLADSVVSHQPDDSSRPWMERMFSVSSDSQRVDLAAYWVVRDRRGNARAAYGFVAPAEDFGAHFTVCSRDGLIPPSLSGDRKTDSLLSLRIYAANNTTLFESPVAYDTTYAAVDTLGQAYGGLTVQAAVRPTAAGTLIIGGMPRSRLPLLVGLMLLTLGVGGAALLQIRREQQLALLRDDFVSGVSHELRTPLAQIRMFGELLDQGRLRTTEERKRSTGVINREARRLTHLVENILHFSRLRRAQANLTMEDTDLRVLIGETVEAFSPIASAQEATLRERIERELVVAADRDAVSQILLNLMDNALKYGPSGQTVTIGLREDHGDAEIVVEDEGPGIPVHARGEIWQAYKRLDRDANTTIGGSGIGLAVVGDLVRMHGGRVWVEDAPAGGARFVVTLPGVRSTPISETELQSGSRWQTAQT